MIWQLCLLLEVEVLILTFVNNLGVSTVCYFVIAFPKRFFTDFGAQKLLWCNLFPPKMSFLMHMRVAGKVFLSPRKRCFVVPGSQR